MKTRNDQPVDVVAAAAAAKYAYREYVENLPYELMQDEWDRWSEAAGEPNKWAFPPLATADNNPTVKMSPDVLYSVVSYDVSDRPLRLSAPVSRDPFWSLTLFQANTDNFFGIDDRAVDSDTFQLIILGAGQSAVAPEGIHVVASPSDKGIAIVRTVVPSPDRLEELEEQRKTATASSVTT
jgi:uncharacterized membrane protein